MNFRKRPVVIEAIRYTNLNKEEIEAFVGTILKSEIESETAYEAGVAPPIQSITIPTKEGDMKAFPGDFIIKEPFPTDDRNFYPCKAEIFAKTYEDPDAFVRNFGWALGQLEEGKAVQRAGWNGKGMFVIKQIPAIIGLDIIPKMQSLPQAAKDILMHRQQPISYTNQMLIVNADGRADSWVPSSSDCFSRDWQVVEMEAKVAFDGTAASVSLPEPDLVWALGQHNVKTGTPEGTSKEGAKELPSPEPK